MDFPIERPELPPCPNCRYRMPRVAAFRLERIPGQMKFRQAIRLCCVECGYYDKSEAVPEDALAELLASLPKRSGSEAPRMEPGRGETTKTKRDDSRSVETRRRAFRAIRGGRS